MPPGSSAAERALRELQLSGRDLGPFVIASHGWLGSQAPPQALLLLEYLPGGDLGLLLERQGPLGPQARLQPYALRLQPYVPRLQPTCPGCNPMCAGGALLCGVRSAGARGAARSLYPHPYPYPYP